MSRSAVSTHQETDGEVETQTSTRPLTDRNECVSPHHTYTLLLLLPYCSMLARGISKHTTEINIVCKIVALFFGDI